MKLEGNALSLRLPLSWSCCLSEKRQHGMAEVLCAEVKCRQEQLACDCSD